MTELESKVDKEIRKKAGNVLRETFLKLVEMVNNNEPPIMEIPKRTLSNTVYDEKRGLLILGKEKLKRNFLDLNEAKRFMQTTLMASIIYDALVNDEYPTIRDLYYRGKHSIILKDPNGRAYEENTWDEQKESDSVIVDIEVFTSLLREDMLILSKEKGKVVGDMRIRSGNDVIDLSKMGHGAYSIEPTPDLIDFMDINAEFVLVVEKDAVFQQLHRAGFWKQYKAILVTSAGQPDRATRRFVRRLNEELKLPVYILTDADPYGWYIYSVFKIGSISLSYESERLATPNARFLGVSMTDIFGDKGKKPYLSDQERRNYIIKAKDADVKRAMEIKNYEWFKTKGWQHEISVFLDKKSKLEIEAMASKGLRFLAFQYIPEKIKNSDFIN
ncbi:DNA topoisomerase IV subunit A [Sulfolobus acidocaldarius]|uniref:Type 2 DNA topoisomerase 6 subunit A n=4 Tax=Sulfolobus acidocaldarius TaxID=2285 RepID=Q4J980_SULAC|nr:DNA topoisomerase IV subunit A [Sulfolobus acidocaldarius]AHC51582.1 DNA topoisomerase VI subunit A [Sulfolobus acidocaldarius SUSAZ]AAY80650.1 DNA topoisomerase VI, subunit A [Sulfolobus acidocaldarius DSM 639]AGE71246.1 DNA topoisomerase VI subunit A [Sulfolobus acidocaldarius N8]AGE73515.1 DNA topoisomerase VI subunit A [Sulfolobus acidocaldarius Ron12/I]ALU30489.1 DNA topoisomerase VI [Sulfolobus acidocaldarius]